MGKTNLPRDERPDGPSQHDGTLAENPVAQDHGAQNLSADPYNSSTQDILLARDSGLADALGTVVVPALTVLFHPRAERIGDRALLAPLRSGEAAYLSRKEPDFATPGTHFEAPLGDRRLSRSPVRLLPTSAGGVAFDPAASPIRVMAEGERLLAPYTWTPEEVERGVVLVLANRVVLLLHHHRTMNTTRPRSFGLVGESSAVARLRFEISQVADLQVPVLLRGATGTGKELVARALHRHSRRSGQLVAVNLGAIPASLAASELFGAVKGAFTGANQHQPGYFQQADQGTLFLDEIGEAPTDVQVQLLRVLETGEVQTLGRQKPHPVDVRLVAATDADLEALADQGTFRAPLLHRLAGYEIQLPPLARRRDDIGRLLLHFLRTELEAIGESERLQGEDVSSWLRPALVAHLAASDWPGNVRQLRNVARQLVIAGRGLHKLSLNPRIERLLGGTSHRTQDDSRDDLDDSRDTAADLDLGDPEATAAESEPRRRPATVGEEELRDTLRVCRWDLKATAEMLRISRTSLYALIEKFPSLRAPGDIPNEEIRQVWESTDGELEAMVETLEISRRALQRRLRELGLGPSSGR